MTGSRDLTLSELDSIDDLDDAMPMEPARAAQFLLYTISALVVLTLVWASIAKLDRVTRGQGWVVTSNNLQELQYLEGGIVKEILVSAGDHVEAGELLVKLDPTQISVEFAQGQEEFNLLSARIMRLEAEAALRPLSFTETFAKAAPEIVARERALYAARAAELDAALSIERKKRDGRGEALEDAKVAFGTAQEAFNLASQELAMIARLVEKGIEPRVELLRAQQREAAARGEMQRAQIAVSRSELESDEANGEIERMRAAFAAAAADDLNAAKGEFAVLKGALPALRDKVARTDVRAPVAGVINRVMVSTVGGVVAPGETIVELVPSDDTLLVEAKIKPADIGSLNLGQAAKVSITAFDPSTYGSLDGVIETISPDAIEDEKSGERFYNIRVRTNADALEGRDDNMRIMSGMAANVSVLNGKRTVLAYIVKPLDSMSERALRDQ